MRYLVKCRECEGTNLEKYEFTLGEGTIGERTEDRFRCLDCDEDMDSAELEFAEDKVNVTFIGEMPKRPRISLKEQTEEWGKDQD